ncbi:hypothetical protein [Rhizobium leguminosarum]|uniref:hypothetical protein n=1 Tax=Rhizobium leguminosarum TaxID=384 RepID=UPI001F42F7D9|nr:hypothetical protein [Rhizobium leguminosarum]UIJ83160.1 hypothetical protein LZK78_32290 [Rhizobium leguminosarum]
MISLDSLQIQPLRGPSLLHAGRDSSPKQRATLRMVNFNPLTPGYFMSRQTLDPSKGQARPYGVKSYSPGVVTLVECGHVRPTLRFSGRPQVIL